MAEDNQIPILIEENSVTNQLLKMANANLHLIEDSVVAVFNELEVINKSIAISHQYQDKSLSKLDMVGTALQILASKMTTQANSIINAINVTKGALSASLYAVNASMIKSKDSLGKLETGLLGTNMSSLLDMFRTPAPVPPTPPAATVNATRSEVLSVDPGAVLIYDELKARRSSTTKLVKVIREGVQKSGIADAIYNQLKQLYDRVFAKKNLLAIAGSIGLFDFFGEGGALEKFKKGEIVEGIFTLLFGRDFGQKTLKDQLLNIGLQATKWGALGFALFGPIGGLIGLAIGATGASFKLAIDKGLIDKLLPEKFEDLSIYITQAKEVASYAAVTTGSYLKDVFAFYLDPTDRDKQERALKSSAKFNQEVSKLWDKFLGFLNDSFGDMFERAGIRLQLGFDRFTYYWIDPIEEFFTEGFTPWWAEAKEKLKKIPGILQQGLIDFYDDAITFLKGLSGKELHLRETLETFFKDLFSSVADYVSNVELDLGSKVDNFFNTITGAVDTLSNIFKFISYIDLKGIFEILTGPKTFAEEFANFMASGTGFVGPMIPTEDNSTEGLTLFHGGGISPVEQLAVIKKNEEVLSPLESSIYRAMKQSRGGFDKKILMAPNTMEAPMTNKKLDAINTSLKTLIEVTRNKTFSVNMQQDSSRPKINPFAYKGG